jgi:hypothetical protein
MRQCGDDVRELMHDGYPVACVGDLLFGYVNVFKTHVNVEFFGGAELDDPAGLLQGTRRLMRHVKLKPGLEINVPELSALVHAAYKDGPKSSALERNSSRCLRTQHPKSRTTSTPRTKTRAATSHMIASTV